MVNNNLHYRIDLTDMADGDIHALRGKKKVESHHFDTHRQALDIVAFLEAQGYTPVDGETLGVKWLIQQVVNEHNETDDNGGLVMEAVE